MEFLDNLYDLFRNGSQADQNRFFSEISCYMLCKSLSEDRFLDPISKEFCLELFPLFSKYGIDPCTGLNLFNDCMTFIQRIGKKYSQDDILNIIKNFEDLNKGEGGDEQ